MTDISLDEHRTIHAEMAGKNACTALVRYEEAPGYAGGAVNWFSDGIARPITGYGV